MVHKSGEYATSDVINQAAADLILGSGHGEGFLGANRSSREANYALDASAETHCRYSAFPLSKTEGYVSNEEYRWAKQWLGRREVSAECAQIPRASKRRSALTQVIHGRHRNPPNLEM
jgi:hypothetical protein